MNETMIKRTLCERFDAGEPLRAGMEDVLRDHPGCEAYCRQLEALDSQMHQLPWFAPDPQFATAVKRRLRDEAAQSTPRLSLMLAAVACCVLASMLAGYLVQDYLPYSEVERQLTAFHWSDLLQDDGVFLEPTPLSSLEGVPYAAQAGDWFDVESPIVRTLESISGLAGQLDLAPLYLWMGLGAACLGMVAFNGALLRSVSRNNTWVQFSR